MKRIILTIVVVLFGWITIGAQGLATKSKMSPWLQKQYRQHQEAVQKNGGPLRVKGRPVRNYILTLVQSRDDGQTIREKGGVVWQDFGGGICAAFMPVDSLSVLDQTPSILRMEANECSKLMNDTSAVLLGVDKAWDFENTFNSSLPPSGGAGEGLLNPSIPQAFTGKGVIAGVMDAGFDFTHPAFRGEDGTSRIKWFWDPLAENENPNELGKIYASPAEVLAAQCSSYGEVEDHGSHVLGSIAGGGLNGRYVGMAPEADIMGASLPIERITDKFLENLRKYIISYFEEDLADVFLAVGLSDVMELMELCKIFEQADAAGQPCVVNWSFGNPASFTDDYTLYEQVFNQLVGPGRIVVMASGNSGDQFTYVKKEADTAMKQVVCIYGTVYSHSFQMRTKPDDDFKAAFAFDGTKDTIYLDSRDVVAALETDTSFLISLSDVEMTARVGSAPYDRIVYVLTVTFKDDYADYLTQPGSDYMRAWGDIIIDTPVEVDMMGDDYFESAVIFGYENMEDSRGCGVGTIAHPASMERSIAVGAMHHRTKFINILGEANTCLDIGSQEGHLATFSSCGPTMSGLVKPDVVAPGHNIISVQNSFYRKNGSEEETKNETIPLTTFKANVFGKDYGMWAMSGTSMACPIATGVVALWLQAKPDLTPEDIKGVIERTSHQPEPEFSGTDKNVYYGWGEIDAYAGLLDILGIATAIPEFSQHQPEGVKFHLQGHTLYIDGAEDGTPIRIYTTDGRLITSVSLSGSSVSLPADSPAGVYAVQVGNLGSTLIRL